MHKKIYILIISSLFFLSSNVLGECLFGNYNDNDEVDFDDVVILAAYDQLINVYGVSSPTNEQISGVSNDLLVKTTGSYVVSKTPTTDSDFNGSTAIDFDDVVILAAYDQLINVYGVSSPTNEQIVGVANDLLAKDGGYQLAIQPCSGTSEDTGTGTAEGTETSTGEDTGTGTDTSTGTATEGLGCEVPASVEIATDKTVSFNPPYPGAKWQSSVSNLDLTDSVLSWDAAVATDSEATIKYSVFECNTSGGSFVATDSMTLTETTMSSADESKAYMVLSYQVVDTIETADEESGRCVEIATDDKRCYSDPEYYNN